MTYTGKFSLDSLISTYPDPEVIPASAQWVIVWQDG